MVKNATLSGYFNKYLIQNFSEFTNIAEMSIVVWQISYLFRKITFQTNSTMVKPYNSAQVWHFQNLKTEYKNFENPQK